MAKITAKQKSKRKKMEKDSWRQNPIKEITITPEWYDGGLDELADFAIALLTGFIWEVKHTDHFHGIHLELQECERIRDHLVWLQKKEFFMPTEDEDLQLTLIDLIRVLPKMWD